MSTRIPELDYAIIAGRITHDLELRKAGSGTLVNFTVAVSRRTKSPSGETKEKTSFIGCTVWDKGAEYLAANAEKGSPVCVEGRIETETWGEGEKKQTKTKVVATRVHLLEWKDDGRTERPKPKAQEEKIDYDDIPF